MVSGREPLFLTILAAGVLTAAVMTLQPYSADSSGSGFNKPAKRYIRAALQHDSVKVARLSVSAVPAASVLNAARTHRDSLVFWAGRTWARTGVRSGDTTEVFLYPKGEVCGEAPIVFRFVGTGNQAKVLSARFPCLDRN